MGFVYPYLNYQMAAGFCILISSILTAVIPHMTRIWSLLVVFVANGLCMGSFEAGNWNFLLSFSLDTKTCFLMTNNFPS